MNYLNWHVGDYASHTGHLTELQDLAFRRMLDHYYLHEKPLPRSPKAIAIAIRMPEREAEVRTVLSEFFVRTQDGYRNKRADEEIARYRAKVEAAANAGRASAQRRSNGRSTSVQRTSNAAATDVQPTSTQEPRTNPQTPTSPLPAPMGGADRAPDPEPAARDPVVAIQKALLRTKLRAGTRPFDRGLFLMTIAERLAPTGIAPGDVDELDAIAREKSEGDGGGLLDEWVVQNAPGYWRDVLAERGMKAKERELAHRAKDSADPLAGVYGG